MLRELHIHNLAVIEDAQIDLRDGFNCFTGETGAGKSLLIGAFEVLLGMRKAAELLRGGADEGRVSGVFELHEPETVRRINEAADLDLDPDADDEQLLVTRKLFASGRSSVSINGQPATASMLRSLGQMLVDVHGQHDHQLLLKPAHQLTMLDHFGGCDELRQRFAELHGRLRELRRRREELEASQSLRQQQLELYEFQAQQIDEAEPTEGEDREVAARYKLLSNLEKVQRDAGSAYGALYEAEGAAVERLQSIHGVLRELAELDEQIGPISDQVRDGIAQLQDAAFDLGRYLNRLELDPRELEEVTERMNTLNRLIQKYGQSDPSAGGTIEDVIEYRRTIDSEIERLRGEQSDLDSIDRQMEPVQRELSEVGRELSRKRKEAADALKPRVEEQLAELGMGEASFDVSLDKLREGEPSAGSPSGFDTAELMVRTNPGQPARPLRKIASGGELSRIMLAIKSIVARSDRLSVLVFDEIDANIGGRMGTVIGTKLRRLAEAHQVLCITHLPQIAAFADHHLKISKTVRGGETKTGVQPLDRETRIEELAEMLSGKNATQTTRKQARELIELAEDGADHDGGTSGGRAAKADGSSNGSAKNGGGKGKRSKRGKRNSSRTGSAQSASGA